MHGQDCDSIGAATPRAPTCPRSCSEAFLAILAKMGKHSLAYLTALLKCLLSLCASWHFMQPPMPAPHADRATAPRVCASSLRHQPVRPSPGLAGHSLGPQPQAAIATLEPPAGQYMGAGAMAETPPPLAPVRLSFHRMTTAWFAFLCLGSNCTLRG